MPLRPCSDIWLEQRDKSCPKTYQTHGRLTAAICSSERTEFWLFLKNKKTKRGPFNLDRVEWSYFLHLFMYARRDRYSDTCPTTIQHLVSGNKTVIVDEFPVLFRVFIFSLQFYQDKKKLKIYQGAKKHIFTLTYYCHLIGL